MFDEPTRWCFRSVVSRRWFQCYSTRNSDDATMHPFEHHRLFRKLSQVRSSSAAVAETSPRPLVFSDAINYGLPWSCALEGPCRISIIVRTICCSFPGVEYTVFPLVYGPLSELQIAYILRETLKGLDYLHKNGKMHRDVKVSSRSDQSVSSSILF